MLLKVLCGIEHLAGAQHRRERAQLRHGGGTRGEPLLFQERHHLLQHGEIGVPVGKETENAAILAERPAPGRGAIARVGLREIDCLVAETDRRKRRAARASECAELESTAVHAPLLLRYASYWQN